MEQDTRTGQEAVENHPPLVCWFCERPSVLNAVLQKGIIVSREARLGGPCRLFTCPYCLNDNLCEETPRGRWFASPNVRLGLVDYLFARSHAKADDRESEALLKAVSWFRENEERRRYFFERDGDHRYSGTSFLKLLWPWGKEEAPAKVRRRSGARKERQEQPESGERRRSTREETGGGRERPEKDPPPTRSPRILTPQEILGVRPGANQEEIQRRFHKLAVQYHPDKVHHLGREFQAQAHKKFVELQKAYRFLTKWSGP